MSEIVKEYIDSFIMNINRELDWKYLKSRRELKRLINCLVFQIDFFSSKYNDCSHIAIRCECRVWYRSYDRSLTIQSGIADIPLLTGAEYWRDITSEDDRKKVSLEIIKAVQEKVLPIVESMERDYNSGLLKLIQNYGLHAFSNSIRLIDETLGREAAQRMASEYVDRFTETEKNILNRFAKGEYHLVNEKNLLYMLENHFVPL